MNILVKAIVSSFLYNNWNLPLNESRNIYSHSHSGGKDGEQHQVGASHRVEDVARFEERCATALVPPTGNKRDWRHAALTRWAVRGTTATDVQE